MRSTLRARRPLLALIALVIALVVGYAVKAADSGDTGGSQTPGPSASVSASSAAGSGVALSSLPTQVSDTIGAIRLGGPFPYPSNDGVVFHNDEHRLPAEPDGYYREYTVVTPGASDRGARRLVVGDGRIYYYTADHYGTFRRVDVTR